MNIKITKNHCTFVVTNQKTHDRALIWRERCSVFSVSSARAEIRLWRGCTFHSASNSRRVFSLFVSSGSNTCTGSARSSQGRSSRKFSMFSGCSRKFSMNQSSAASSSFSIIEVLKQETNVSYKLNSLKVGEQQFNGSLIKLLTLVDDFQIHNGKIQSQSLKTWDHWYQDEVAD